MTLNACTCMTGLSKLLEEGRGINMEGDILEDPGEVREGSGSEYGQDGFHRR